MEDMVLPLKKKKKNGILLKVTFELLPRKDDDLTDKRYQVIRYYLFVNIQRDWSRNSWETVKILFSIKKADLIK